MNRLRKVVGNTLISLLGQGVTWVSTLTLTIAYGRFLGDIKFGELYFAITFVTLIGFPIEFGFNQQLTRDVAQEPAKALRYLTNIVCMKLFFWALLYACILVLCWLLRYPPERQLLVAICGVSLLSGAIANTMASLHYAFERVVFPVIGTVLEKGLIALVGLIVLRYGAGVQVMAYVLLGGSLANMLWQTAWILRLLDISFNIDLTLMRELARKSIPFLVYGVLGVIYYRLDTILLSFLTNDAVIGWYGAGYRLFDTLVFLPSLVISAIMYPVFSKLSVDAKADLKLAVEKSLNFLLFCGFPISTGLITGAPNIIAFLYHRSEFVHAIPSLQALAPGLLFLYVNSVLTSVLVSTKREKNVTKMAAVALVFNLALNLILIPRFEHVGAAVVTSLTELLLMCLALFFLPRSMWPTKSIKVGVKALLASLVMALAIWALHQFSIFAILPVALVVYLAVATLLGTIPRSDLKALYTSIRHKASHTTAASATDAQTVEPGSESVEILTEEEMQPDLEEVLLSWRRELTDPALVAYGRDLRLPDTSTRIDIDDDEATIPRLAVVRPRILGRAPADIDSMNAPTLPRIPRIAINMLPRTASSEKDKATVDAEEKDKATANAE